MGALVTKNQIDSLVRKYDPDRTGRISEEDYLRIMAEVQNNPDNLDMVRASFSAFDKQGTGLLSCAEMNHVLTRIGDTLNQEEMSNFLSMMDGGSGTITMGDLINLFQSQTGEDLFSKKMQMETNNMHNLAFQESP